MTLYTDRVVVLVDMDCFYCQVEEKLDPKLVGKPIAVVQYNAWRGGGIIAVNYPAKDRGVTRHMRGNEAKEKCPEIELVRVPNVRGKADLTKYREAGKRVAEVLQTFTPLLQRASVDEAYLDITDEVNQRLSTIENRITKEQLPNTHVVGCDTTDFIHNIYSDIDNEGNLKLAIGGAIVEEIRAAVYEKTGYRCSAGIAHNKILAKLACGLYKPNQQTILPHDGVEILYRDLPLKKIKSLGGKFGESLSEDLNITYMGELIKFSEKELQKKFDDKTASWLYNIARGIDKEPVEVRLISKSIGCCKKFPGKTALTTVEDVTHWLSELATEISERLEQDTEENNRRAKSITISFAQPVNRKNVHSSRVHPLNSYDAKRITNDAFEILKKMAQKPDGSFKLTFLGLNVGKFEDCKNVKDISTFFKPSIKGDLNLTINNNLDKNCDTTIFFKQPFQNKQNLNKNSKSIASFFKSVPNNDINKSDKTENKENINKNANNYSELNINDIEEDAELSEDIDLNQTIQDIQNLKSINDEHNFYSDDTIEEDYTEILKNKQEYPHVSELYKAESEKELVDTSKSFFMKYAKNLDSNETKNEEIPIINIEESSQDNTDIIFDQPSCSYRTTPNTTTTIALYNENSNSSSIIDDMEKICPECRCKVHQFDYISHMDHHMAEKLMAEERQLFQIEFQAKKQNLNAKNIVKTSNPNRNKSVKRKPDNNNSITSFLTPKKELENKDTKLCTECDKRIPINEFNCHLDFHAAKKLHLELNPVKYGGKTETINKKKNCKSANGMLSISNFFKTVEN